MQSPRGIASVTLAALIATAVFSLAEAQDDRPDGERRAVLRVVQRGQQAVVEDRPRLVCRLLTRRARRNSLKLFNLYHHPDGRPRPRPKTCATAVGYQIDDARDGGELRELRPGGGLHATRVVAIDGRRARVRKTGHTDIYLIKTPNGWRGDHADFAPFDGSSGY